MPFVNAARSTGPNKWSRISEALGGFGNLLMNYHQMQQQQQDRDKIDSANKQTIDILKSMDQSNQSALGRDVSGSVDTLEGITPPKIRMASLSGENTVLPKVNLLGKENSPYPDVSIGNPDLSASSSLQSPKGSPSLESDVNYLKQPETNKQNLYAEASPSSDSQTATDAMAVPSEDTSQPTLKGSLLGIEGADNAQPSQNLLAEQTPDPMQVEKMYGQGVREMIQSAPDESKAEIMKTLGSMNKIAQVWAQAGHPEKAFEYMKNRLDILKNLHGVDTKTMDAYLKGAQAHMDKRGKQQKEYDMIKYKEGVRLESAYRNAGQTPPPAEILESQAEFNLQKYGITPDNVGGPGNQQQVPGQTMGSPMTASSPTAATGKQINSITNPGMIPPGKPRQPIEDKAKIRDEKTLADVMDTVSSVKRGANAGLYGMAVKRTALADDGLRLIGQVKSGEITGNPQVESELASVIASMLMGGNQPGEQTIKSFETKTGVKGAAKIAEYISGHPQQSITKSFLDQFEKQLNGQKKFWAEKRSNITGGQEIKLEPIFARDMKKGGDAKDRWDRFLKTTFPEAGSKKVTPDDINKMSKDELKAYLGQ